MSDRHRLPNRREQFTETIDVAGQAYEASVGFDEFGRPREIFLAGAKDGSDTAAILADSAVVISVALQHGVLPSDMAHTLSRVPLGVPGMADNDDEVPSAAASVIGAALDLLVRYETEVWR